MLRRNPLWPYLLVLALLFILIVNAPRSWERIANNGALRTELASRARSQVYQYIPPAQSIEPVKIAPTAATNDEAVGDDVAEAVNGHGARELAHDVAVRAIESSDRSSIKSASPANLSETAALINSDDADRDVELATEEPGGGVIPAPMALYRHLDQLAEYKGAATWASNLRAAIRSLERAHGSGLADALKEVAATSQDAQRLSDVLSDEHAKTVLRRVEYALARRMAVWQRVVEDQTRLTRSKTLRQSSLIGNDMLAVIQELRTQLASGSEHGAWESYLLLGKVEHVARLPGSTDSPRAAIAREVLGRMTAAGLTTAQQDFLAQHSITEFARQLSAWSEDRILSVDVLHSLETLEATGDQRALARQLQALNWSDDAGDQELAAHLGEHYRSANLRLAVTAAFVNRMLPAPESRVAPVYDHIMGANVRGQSTTQTTLAVRLVPDANRLRVGLEARGWVQSNTASTSGPATFYSSGESTFLVRKLFLFGHRGLYIFPAVSEANNEYSALQRMETDYDGIPLIGQVVRNIARSEHDSAQGQARSMTESRIASQSSNELDRELEPRVQEARRRFATRVQAPLEKLGLHAEPIETSTTAERLTMRVRLAGHDQLAAHTARPRALSNSMISVQVHESALNNALDRLQLDGREFMLPELYAWIADRLSRQPSKLPDDLPEDVTVKFASEGAVRLRCEGEQIEVRLSIARLKQGQKQWRDFRVRAVYRPDHGALTAQFVRDGAIFLDGPSLKGRPQVVLRAVFSKVLSNKRPWSIIDERLAGDPRLQDLELTQFVCDDGWIALAYGPRPTPVVASGAAGRQ